MGSSEMSKWNRPIYKWYTWQSERTIRTLSLSMRNAFQPWVNIWYAPTITINNNNLKNISNNKNKGTLWFNCLVWNHLVVVIPFGLSGFIFHWFPSVIFRYATFSYRKYDYSSFVFAVLFRFCFVFLFVFNAFR